jgi:hypothetical protein
VRPAAEDEVASDPLRKTSGLRDDLRPCIDAFHHWVFPRWVEVARLQDHTPALGEAIGRLGAEDLRWLPTDSAKLARIAVHQFGDELPAARIPQHPDGLFLHRRVRVDQPPAIG